jgi:hypothetical protein
LLPESPRWGAAPATRADRRAKWRSIAEYRSQVQNFGPLVIERIGLYEGTWGGEGVAWANGTSDKPSGEDP